MFVMAIAAATLIQHALCHMKAPYKYMQLLKDYFGHIIYPEAQIHSYPGAAQDQVVLR